MKQTHYFETMQICCNSIALLYYPSVLTHVITVDKCMIIDTTMNKVEI